jgi:pilus assembly protein CpaF
MAWARSNKQLVSEGMPGAIREKVMEFITQKKNGIISGDEGSGKGNLLVALVAEIAEQQRVLVVESPAYIKGPHANIVRLPKTGRVLGVHPPEAVLAAALDHDPAHTVVGYIRNEHDYRLLRALNEQHGGTLSTMHAISAPEALDKLRQLAASAQPATQSDCPGAEIASDIDFVLHCEHDHAGRKRVASLLAVTGYNRASNEFETEELYRAPDTHAA